jgi:hypothetical protein
MAFLFVMVWWLGVSILGHVVFGANSAGWWWSSVAGLVTGVAAVIIAHRVRGTRRARNDA